MITQSIQWFTSTERLPDCDLLVLVYGPDMDGPKRAYYDDSYEQPEHRWWDENDEQVDGVAIWAEMPAYPTEAA